jgi:hypothetical protein
MAGHHMEKKAKGPPNPEASKHAAHDGEHTSWPFSSHAGAKRKSQTASLYLSQSNRNLLGIEGMIIRDSWGKFV